MFKRLLLLFVLFGIVTTYSSPAYADGEESTYSSWSDVHIGTFNEYRYKITDEFFEFRNKYEIDAGVDATSARKILELAKKGYNYLPDSLSNKNYYNHLKTSIERGIKYPTNTSNYSAIVVAIENYLDKTNIQSITGRVEAYPSTGNAPLTVTLRGNVSDPTGTKIPSYSYTWWMHENGKKVILGDNISLTHVFTEEGNYSVFLDVVSSHKNELGYTDVLPFSSRADITIKEKVASVIIKVNGINLRSKEGIKFTPEEARYGLLFDATSSTPTSGSEFIKTTWDFGNGEVREYSGYPRVERVVYAREGEYTASLKLKTNELKQIERKFHINIHDPIATINSSQDEGFMGDKFTFSAQSSGNDKNLSYSWEIIDLEQDKVVLRKTGTLFTYSFPTKGKYNVKMQVTELTGETDIDSKIIYINSRQPVADFTTKIPFKNKPNKVFLDATKSYDPDYTDDGNLKYSWIVDGNRVVLDEANYNGSTGYYTFDSIGEHSIKLDVEDPDGISSQKSDKVNVQSILSVDFFAFPRVVQRLGTVRFVSEAPEADFYEWNFGDGYIKGGNEENISHKYVKSGIFDVTLKVRKGDFTNQYTKKIYIGESDNPYSFITVKDKFKGDIYYDKEGCSGSGAYIANRVDPITFSGKESINIDGSNKGLTYSWKLGRESYKTSQEFTKKFDELGCFPIKLTVKSETNGRVSSKIVNVEVRNLKPVMSSLDIRVVDENTDPVIVNLNILGPEDKDGVIQSYLWYYYTDIDSEPQNFRATRLPSTSFVLPKVTGTYYFVVVMKDNNLEIISSEEINNSKYYIELVGDNMNTPIVGLGVDNSSVAIGDEVVFTADVQNVIGDDLTKKVKYSWDFDGDGFYDKESNSNVETYKYLTSGEKHIKVKAKYKGLSNTKSVGINVANILKPKFGYISIGNEFIFFDESLGSAETYEWDLGDSSKMRNKKIFTHIYEGSKATQQVKLKISEGTKVKEVEQKVIKNVKNRILAKKDGLIMLANQPISSNNEITIKEKGENLFVYLGKSKPNIENYVIDFDINYDSNLNGGSDDDQDNEHLKSYENGEPTKVILNDEKFQTFRVYVKNSDGEIVDSRDYTINKEYIEENLIDLEEIIFEGVSDSTKLKIEKLKDIVNTLPKQHKLKALMYVQKLKEEWGDNREKTNIILEFEGFIYETEVSNANEIIDLLESLLVENQEDKSEKAITFNALKNLLPSNIACTDATTGAKELCYDLLIGNLEEIRDNDNSDENKVLGSEILKAVQENEIMTNKQKIDFKAILKTLVYGGVENIPDSEKEEVIEETEKESGNLLGLLRSIGFWIIIIVLVFFGLAGMFYVYYLLTNKNNNVGFQDFIIDKTQGGKSSSSKDDFDVLDDLGTEKNKKEEVEKDTMPNPLGNISTDTKKEESKTPEIKKENIDKNKFTEKEEQKTTEVKKEVTKDTKSEKKNDEVPDWLKGSFSEDEKETKSVSKTQDNKESKGDDSEKKNNEVPDWLKGSFSEDDEKTVVKDTTKQESEIKEEKSEIKEEKQERKFDKQNNDSKSKKVASEEKVKEISDEEIEKATQIEEESIPDWLKGSFSEETKTEETKTGKSEKEESKKEESKTTEDKKEKNKNKETTQNKKETIEKDSKDDNIPDWLKGSFSEETKTEETKTGKSEKEESKKEESKTTEDKKETIEKDSKKQPEKETTKETKKESKKSEVKVDTKNLQTKNEKSKSQEVKKEKTQEQKESKKETNKKGKTPNTEKQSNKKTQEKSKQIDKKETTNKSEETIKAKESDSKKTDKKDTTSKIDKANDKTEKNTELWDDGMKVPDWLKTDDEK